MKSNSKKVYAILTGFLIASIIFSVIIFIAGWVYTFKLSSQMGKTRTESEYLEKEVAVMENLKKNFKTVSGGEALTVDSVPKDKEVSSFMADIEGLASKNKLKITESLIGLNKNKSKVSDPSLSQLVKVNNYYELQIKFNLKGSYSGYLAFVEEVDRLRRVTSISSISLLRTNEAILSKTDEVKAEFVTSIYVKQ